MAINPRTIKVAGATLVAAGTLAIGIIAKWEPAKDPGLVYADALAGGLPTVCNGITKHVTKTPVIVGERWTKQQCADEEAVAIYKVQLQLAKCFVRPPPQAVFDMATSHAWNNGASATCGSMAMQAWNEGDWERGCKRLSRSDSGKPVWAYVTQPDGSKRFVQGLANRRADETKTCLENLP